MFGYALLETVVFGKIGIDGDPLAIDIFLRRGADRAGRAAALDAEQIFGFAYRVLAPTGLENGLGDRYRSGDPGRHHRTPRIVTDKVDELLLCHLLDVNWPRR